MVKLDAKFYGEIRKVKDDSIVPDDQCMTFLIKDNAFWNILPKYREECIQLGADQEHIDVVDRTIARGKVWRDANPHLLKVPDAKGEKLRG